MLVRGCTQNLAGLTILVGRGLRPAAGMPPLQRALATWTPRLIALLIALELGLLSPLSCVIHCFVQQMLAERPAIAFFLCGEHRLAAPGAQAVPFAASSQRATPDPAPPASTIKPRALYELVALPSPLLTAVTILVAVLQLPPVRRLAPQALPPPSPPPRRSPA